MTIAFSIWRSLRNVVLGNPMDRGASGATVHGVRKEQDSTEGLNSNNRMSQTKADWGAFEKEWQRYTLQIKPVLIKILTNIENNDYEALCYPWFNLLSIESVAQISMRRPAPLFSLSQISQPQLFYKSVFPCGSAGKESTCNEGDLDSIPGLGRFP